MFLVDLTFIEPLVVVDKHVAAHREYLSSYYEQGVFVLGGRKRPRTGGIILCRLASREELEAILDSDPLVVANAATYEVIEFEPVMRAKELLGIF